MDERFKIPAGAFLAGLAVWILLLILHLNWGWMSTAAPVPQLSLSLLSAGLIGYSGIRCRRVGGPRIGGIFRTAALIILAAVGFWKIGVGSAVILIIGAGITVSQLFITKK